ncbi:MAG: ATP-binding protein, partial [Alloacidobacterium sp.]
AMSSVCARAVAAGFEAIAFGDLFLADVRRYREERLAGTGLQPIFPLWGINTAELVRTMLRARVKARIVCVDTKKLPREFAGCDLEEPLLQKFSPDIDPCAENGEFHTCAYAGPMFRKPIAIKSGEVVERDGFVFADVKLSPDAVGASGDA